MVVIDRAIADEAELTAHLERLLGGTVHTVSVHRLDLVNDTTSVEVRYEVGHAGGDAVATEATGGWDGAAR
jgi:hypothetical protein